jgi:hypothetical protein
MRRDMQGRDCDLNEELFQNVLRESEKNNERTQFRIARLPAEIRTEYLQDTILGPHSYGNTISVRKYYWHMSYSDTNTQI